MELFRNRFRVKSARMRLWDYGNPGLYFITICTQDMKPWMGNVVEGEVRLSDCGIIVENEWNRTADLRPNVRLDRFVVMPNHVHGIIAIHERRAPAETHGSASLRDSVNRFGPQSQNLASIIRGFKAASSRRIRSTVCPEFSWQSRFYDHLIRCDESLDRIRDYITANPGRWGRDRHCEEQMDWECRDARQCVSTVEHRSE